MTSETANKYRAQRRCTTFSTSEQHRPAPGAAAIAASSWRDTASVKALLRMRSSSGARGPWPAMPKIVKTWRLFHPGLAVLAGAR